ncbi:hypothetical protein PR048_008568 [Dryococelus australis]|uniref:Uncharacterized protein n=1 Tax=Dryococelus australis TaxID=614101 RepID=A0ABQ9HYB1_9NEOP|nr:hypothetical protein PR048_008568 [Dryococelus australis]
MTESMVAVKVLRKPAAICQNNEGQDRCRQVTGARRPAAATNLPRREAGGRKNSPRGNMAKTRVEEKREEGGEQNTASKGTLHTDRTAMSADQTAVGEETIAGYAGQEISASCIDVIVGQASAPIRKQKTITAERSRNKIGGKEGGRHHTGWQSGGERGAVNGPGLPTKVSRQSDERQHAYTAHLTATKHERQSWGRYERRGKEIIGMGQRKNKEVPELFNADGDERSGWTGDEQAQINKIGGGEQGARGCPVGLCTQNLFYNGITLHEFSIEAALVKETEHGHSAVVVRSYGRRLGTLRLEMIPRDAGISWNVTEALLRWVGDTPAARRRKEESPFTHSHLFFPFTQAFNRANVIEYWTKRFLNARVISDGTPTSTNYFPWWEMETRWHGTCDVTVLSPHKRVVQAFVPRDITSWGILSLDHGNQIPGHEVSKCEIDGCRNPTTKDPAAAQCTYQAGKLAGWLATSWTNTRVLRLQSAEKHRNDRNCESRVPHASCFLLAYVSTGTPADINAANPDGKLRPTFLATTTHQRGICGATAVERLRLLASHQSEKRSIQDFRNRAGRCRWSAGFLGDLQFPLPFHSAAAPSSPQSPSLALKASSILRAAQISSLLQGIHPQPFNKVWDVHGTRSTTDGNTARQFSALRVREKWRQASLRVSSEHSFPTANALKTSVDSALKMARVINSQAVMLCWQNKFIRTKLLAGEVADQGLIGQRVTARPLRAHHWLLPLPLKWAWLRSAHGGARWLAASHTAPLGITHFAVSRRRGNVDWKYTLVYGIFTKTFSGFPNTAVSITRIFHSIESTGKLLLGLRKFHFVTITFVVVIAISTLMDSHRTVIPGKLGDFRQQDMELSGQIWAASKRRGRIGRSEVSMEQRRNAAAGETGDPRGNPPTSGIVRHHFHVRKFPAGNRTEFAWLIVSTLTPPHLTQGDRMQRAGFYIAPLCLDRTEATRVKVVHDKVSTFEINRRKTLLLLPA